MNFNKIQVGGPNDHPAVTTTISSNEYNNTLFLRQGWLCPKCQKILNPAMDFCPFCSGNNNVMPETTNTPTKREWWRDYCTISSDPSKLPKQELPITIDDTDTFRVHYDQLPYYTTITSWS